MNSWSLKVLHWQRLNWSLLYESIMNTSEGCPVLPSNVTGCLTNPMFTCKSDTCTKMSDSKKKRRGKHHSLALALTLTLTVTLGPNHPATRHCWRLCYTALSLTDQHYTRASQDHLGIIPGQLKATLDKSNTSAFAIRRSMRGSTTVQKLVVSKVARVGCKISLNRLTY